MPDEQVLLDVSTPREMLAKTGDAQLAAICRDLGNQGEGHSAAAGP